MSRSELDQLLVQRRAAFEAFQAWEDGQPVPEYGTSVLSRLGFLNSLLPPSARVPNLDLEYEGVRYMHKCLSVLGTSK